MEKSISEKTVDRAFRMVQLLDTYGSLLTEKQRRFVELHYGSDLSFGEIATEHSVSRQAVHDAVKHAENALEEYEAKLGLMGHGAEIEVGTIEPIAEETGEDKTGKAIEMLDALKKNIRRQGIIYNSSWIISEIEKIRESLR
jgi:predicted DNA-binding protein YlxM (UPF0122 family)